MFGKPRIVGRRSPSSHLGAARRRFTCAIALARDTLRRTLLVVIYENV